MRAVIQRVLECSVRVGGEVRGKISKGLLILLGVGNEDERADIDWLVRKVIGLRVFSDEDDMMNLSLEEISGDILVVSQFTLFASTKKGKRPSYIRAARPDKAERMYLDFVSALEVKTGKKIATGVFGADMKVSLVNDGPVTILIDTKNKE